jgi:hypothetical protein
MSCWPSFFISTHACEARKKTTYFSEADLLIGFGNGCASGREFVSLRQTRIISSVLAWVNLATFVYLSPAFAFIGRTIIASRTPGRILRKTPPACLGVGLGGVVAILSSPVGFILRSAYTAQLPSLRSSRIKSFTSSDWLSWNSIPCTLGICMLHSDCKTRLRSCA